MGTKGLLLESVLPKADKPAALPRLDLDDIHSLGKMSHIKDVFPGFQPATVKFPPRDEFLTDRIENIL